MVKSLGKVNYFSSDSAFWQALTFAFAARGKFSFCARILKFFFLAPLQTKKETYFKIQLVNSATAAGSTLACFFCYSVRLDSLKLRLRLWQAAFLFFFFFFCFFFSRVVEECGNCCSLNNNRKCWLFHRKQCIYALFTDP